MEIPIPEHLSDVGLALVVVYILVRELISRSQSKREEREESESIISQMREFHEKSELAKVLGELKNTIEKNTAMLDSILEEQRFFRAEISRLKEKITG